MEGTNKNMNEIIKNRMGYGKKVPIFSFEEVIEITKITYTKAGDSSSLDALSRITGNSSSSSTFNKKVAALRNFGVFNFDKINYELTELGERIAKPESYEEQAKAIIEAFSNLENLKKIWEAYKGKRLPQEEYLENAIVKIIGIPIKLKEKWAEYFVAAGKYAGLLDEREPGSYQVLQGYTPALKRTEGPELSNEVPQNNNQVQVTPNIPEEPKPIDPLGMTEQTWGILNYKTVSNNRKAVFAIPEELTQKDIDSLKVFLKGIEIQLDGLKKFNEE